MDTNSSSSHSEELAREVQSRLSPLGVAGSFLAGLFAYCVYQYYFSPLAGIPGPFTVRCGLYGWRTLHGLKFDYAEQLQYWHRSTGSPLVRISSHQVSVADPAAIPIIYKNWNKTGFYNLFKFTSIDTGMSTKDHEAHKRQVKSDGPLFTKASLAQQEPYMDTCANDFMDLLKRESVNGKTVQNLGRTLRYYTLDIIGEIAFGETFHALEKNDKSVSAILDKIDVAVYGIFLGGIHPRIAPALIKIAQRFNLLDINFVRRTASAGAHKSIERKKAGAEREDLMAKMLSLKHWSGGPYSLEEVEGMASVFFGAGTDTAAVVLRAFVYYMVKNPSVHAELMEEIDAAVAKGELHFPTAHAEAIKLLYFKACLDEVIRLHPAVPMPLPRTVPKGGAVIAGHFFPEGFEVGMSPFVLQRSEAAFGADAEEFKPSRWLDANINERVAMHAKILSFGTLARVCVGKDIGLQGVSKLVINFLYHYDVAFVPRSASSPHKLPARGYGGNTDREPWNVDEGFLAAQNDFWCEMTARNVEDA